MLWVSLATIAYCGVGLALAFYCRYYGPAPLWIWLAVIFGWPFVIWWAYRS